MRLTKVIVVAAIALGVLVAIGQLALTVHSYRQDLLTTIQSTVETVHPFAAATAFELDRGAAEDITAGLILNPIILSAAIVDDVGDLLARTERPESSHPFTFLLTWALSDLDEFVVQLEYNSYEEPIGSLIIGVDTDAEAAAILDEAWSILLFGIARNVLLALLLIYIINRLVTAPLNRLSRELQNSVPLLQDDTQVEFQAGHEHDELGQIVESLNSLLARQQRVSLQLRRSQKMDAFGQLASGIAHDFNNILGVIMGNLELMQLDPSDPRAVKEFSDSALEASQRGADLARKLLDFSRVDAGITETISTKDFVEGIYDLIKRSITPSIALATRIDDDVWPVRANVGDLQDALINLCMNARDAMPQGGDLIIEIANTVLDEEFAARYPQASVGPYVVIGVTDNGTGMSEDIQKKVLEPFFTTKEAGKGTGLGLSMAHSFAVRTGGHLSIYSALGEGTSVRMYLPADTEGENAAVDFGERGRSIEPPVGDETILVVDDEPQLLLACSAMLRQLGYEVLTADSGARALEILSDRKDIDLLLTDVIMPSMDGYTLALRARELSSQLPVLLTSGFAAAPQGVDKADEQVLERLTARLVYKPYTRLDLATSVRRALDD